MDGIKKYADKYKQLVAKMMEKDKFNGVGVIVCLLIALGVTTSGIIEHLLNVFIIGTLVYIGYNMMQKANVTKTSSVGAEDVEEVGLPVDDTGFDIADFSSGAEEVEPAGELEWEDFEDFG